MREMKDSGVAWIGEIPANWEISTVNSLYTLRNQKVSDRDYSPLSVTMKGVVPQLETAAKTNAHDDRKLVKKGDFAINSRSDRRGSCGISDYDGSVSLINTVLTPRGKMHPVYYNWLFHSSEFADEFYRWGHGIVDDLWTTRWQEMRNITIPVPEYAEQQKIASYLDRRCSQIDALIANVQKQIERLKAYKQSIITETVTKGLDKNAPMKNSGVEWIGDIPEHWDTISLSSLSKGTRNGYVGPTKKLFFETGVKYIQSLHIKEGKIDFFKHEYYVSEAWANQHPKIHTGNLLIVQTGDIGQVAVVTEEYDGCNCHALIIVEVNNETILSEYLSFYLQSKVGKELLLATKTGALLPHLNSGRIGSTMICVPPLQEQGFIIDVLNNKTALIDRLIALKQQKIQKLQQYKKSLIYEYVTGKKEV